MELPRGVAGHLLPATRLHQEAVEHRMSDELSAQRRREREALSPHDPARHATRLDHDPFQDGPQGSD